MLRMLGITKSYGSVRANRGIDLVVPPRTILGLLGENGSGKTTLMNVLFGLVRPDAGTITFKERPLADHTPREALAAGIGMIHQHFMLVPAMTVTENVMLGWDAAGRWLRPAAVAEHIRTASHRYGLDLEPDARVGALPLGGQQRVEIVKAILRGAELLILDEPTSNLSPPEVSGLLDVLRRLRDEGRSVIFISHKLGEVLAVCDEVVVLRDGAVAGRARAADTDRAKLARMMVDRDVSAPIAREEGAAGAERLVVADLVASDATGVERLGGVSFSVRSGEVLAVAGVDGNGQAELVDVIAGLRRPTRGHVFVDGADVTARGVTGRRQAGLAHIPADRHTTGLVGDMTVSENLAFRDCDGPPFRRGPWLDFGAMRVAATERIARFGIRAGGPDVAARTLSGGNQQKLVLARELTRRPGVLVAAQPTRGLDPGATRFVIDEVLAVRASGGAVLYVSTELEEALVVADRIAVMYRGRFAGVMRRDAVDITRLGLMMAGALSESPDAAALYGRKVR
ncbi:MAG: heme ABC transporter ATP-binding protein [Candidatus Rokuibacteriota bacterium]|nr:MAG: heme ABC transporter ATP-binding protein [Candidatus Rokubacteria bacterium]